ncbi:MAG TPA: GNAT family N-acetyltransferase [Bacteroidia bacterium]|nr:GNAT family N-acetyltransferase [Bacteroidia bacterium]
MEEAFPYRIERLRDDLLPDVQRLFAEVMHQDVSLEYLRRKYDTRHSGHQYLSSIAYDGHRPVAFYGAIPQIFSGPTGQFVGCHAADLMTVADHQRKGLHRQLGLAAYAWMRAEGVRFVYGFLSENSYQSSMKLDWRVWGKLRGYALKAARFPLAKVFRRVPGLREWQVSRTSKALSQYALAHEDFFNSNAASGISVEYSQALIASKAFHKHYLVAFSGVKFWLSIDAVVRVGDVHFENAMQFDQGLSELIRIARKLGYGQILFQTYPGSPLDNVLAQQHEGFESWIVGYLPLGEEIDFMQYRPNYADQDSF